MLQNAHAYKAALDQGRPANLGLFAYPVLMAVDILIYQSNIVPVGRDQKQHVEMTRDLALKFNKTFGEIFTIPEPSILASVETVRGLDGQKMSKSYDNTIELFSAEKALRKKVMSIVTDSTPVEAPKETENSAILELYRLFASEAEVEEMAASIPGRAAPGMAISRSGSSRRCGVILSRCGGGGRNWRGTRLTSSKCCETERRKANALAGATLQKAREAVGLLRRHPAALEPRT